jgi:hypothetical protein
MQSNFLCSLALAAVLGASACDFERGREGSGTAKASASTRDAVHFRIEPARVDFGTLTLGETATRAVTVTNRTSTPLVLGTAGTLGPCRWTLPAPVPARGSASAELSCSWMTAGAVGERLDVTATDQPQDHQLIEISAHVEPLLGFEPNYVDFELDFGERATREVRLFGKLADDESVAIAGTGDDLVSAVLHRVRAPRGATLQIECRGDRVGMHAGSIRFALPKGSGPDAALSWGCKVKGTLTVEPATPYFNLRQSGDRATTVIVKSTKPGFKVLGARVTEGPFLADVRPRLPSGEYAIIVKVRNRLVPDEARAVTGTLLVTSNDETEPRKSIPLFGMGHVNKVERLEGASATSP